MFGPVLAFIVGWGRFREERDHTRTDALLPVNFLGSFITFLAFYMEVKLDSTPGMTLWDMLFSYKYYYVYVQGDTSRCPKPPVDFKTEVLLWPDQASPGQATTELLFSGQWEVLDNVMCHPVSSFKHILSNIMTFWISIRFFGPPCLSWICLSAGLCFP